MWACIHVTGIDVNSFQKLYGCMTTFLHVDTNKTE